MSAIDISKLTYEELLEFSAAAEKRLEGERSAHRIAVAKRVYHLIKGAGLSLDEVLPYFQEPDFAINIELEIAEAFKRANPPKRVPRSLPKKYQNPSDASQQWSGKGRAPFWFTSHIDNGGKREDLLIKNEPA